MSQTNFEREERKFERFYRLGRLWLRLRSPLKSLAWGLFVALDTALLLFFVWRFVDFGIFDYETERAIIGAIVDGSGDLSEITRQRGPEGVTVEETGALARDEFVDFYAELTNQSDNWSVRFTYVFRFDGGETEPRSGFLLPAEKEKTVVALEENISGKPRDAEIVLSDVRWSRVDAHEISDYEEWSGHRLAFEFENVENERETIDGQTLPRTTFTVRNNGAYGFVFPSFVVILRRNQTIVGVNSVTIPDFEPGQSRDVTLAWPAATPNANAVEIEPQIDLFDPDVFLSR